MNTMRLKKRMRTKGERRSKKGIINKRRSR